MNQEEKQLLLKDLCSRLPYGKLFVYYNGNKYTIDTIAPNDYKVDLLNESGFHCNDIYVSIEYIKPYLYPESEVSNLISPKELSMLTGYELYDWYDKNHIAYRTLNGKDIFELGLAVQAPKEMYNN